jgi:hypothetical protein
MAPMQLANYTPERMGSRSYVEPHYEREVQTSETLLKSPSYACCSMGKPGLSIFREMAGFSPPHLSRASWLRVGQCACCACSP